MTIRSALILSLLLPACGGDDPVSQETFAVEDLAEASSALGYTEAAEEVIRSEAAWAAAWERLFQGEASPPVPEVDFSRDMLLLVGLGAMSSGGVGVRIVSATRYGDELYVDVEVGHAGDGCLTPPAVTYPTDVVRVQRYDGEVWFVRRDVVVDC